MEGRTQFTFYRSYWEALRDIPKRERLAVYEAVCAYALDGVEPELTGVARAVFALVKPTLDSGRRKAASGKLGGESDKQKGSKQEAKEKQIATEKDGEVEVEKEIEIEGEAEDDSPPPPSPSPQIDFGRIVEGYNQVCKELPRVERLNDKRRKAIRARVASGYSQEDFDRLWQKAARSSFLTGRNKRDWRADFDFLISDKGMTKTLEGLYDDRQDTAPKGASGQLGQAELEAIQRVLREG